MKCLFCGDKLMDATLSMSICMSKKSKKCEFSFYRYEFLLHYYVCVNRKIAIVDWGWMPNVKRNFFTEYTRKGTFISYNSSKYKEFENGHRLFLKE